MHAKDNKGVANSGYGNRCFTLNEPLKILRRLFGMLVFPTLKLQLKLQFSSSNLRTSFKVLQCHKFLAKFKYIRCACV